MKYILITLTLISLIASPLLAFGYMQKEDKIIDGIHCTQHYIEGNGWEIRSFFNKDTDDLYSIKIWHDDNYIGDYRRVK